MHKKRVAITGAAGLIGRALRAGFRGRYSQLRLCDRLAIEDLGSGEEFRCVDLTDLRTVLGALEGMDAVVHLGGKAQEGTWEEVLKDNIVGTYNVFEAARNQGVKRVVFASTNHVVGFYPRDRTVDTAAVPRPDSRYAVSKVFGEALGRLHADKYGISVVCLRIGSFQERPLNVRMLSTWISPSDTVHLVQQALEVPDVRFEIVYGVSANTRNWWTDRAAECLGYQPKDNAEDYAQEISDEQGVTQDFAGSKVEVSSLSQDDVLRAVAANVVEEPPVERRFQGGPVCGLEFAGDPDLYADEQ